MTALATLRRRALDGTLEVEHLLKAAKLKPIGLRDDLLQLSAQMHWSYSGFSDQGTRVVPLAKWAEVVGAYSEGGFEAILPYTRSPEGAGYVLGLLEELSTLEAVDFLLWSYSSVLADPAPNRTTAFAIASTLNLLLSFKPAFSIGERAKRIQSFLLSLFALSESDRERAVVLLALRGVGDAEAERFIAAALELSKPWHTAKTSALRAVRKRLSKGRHLQPLRRV